MGITNTISRFFGSEQEKLVADPLEIKKTAEKKVICCSSKNLELDLLSDIQKGLLRKYNRAIREILSKTLKVSPLVPQQVLRDRLVDLRNQIMKGDPRNLPKKSVFRSQCELVRREIAAEAYRANREDFQKLSAKEFLAKKKGRYTKDVLREIGLKKGVFFSDLDYLGKTLPNNPEQTYGELIFESAQIFAKKYGVNEKALYRIATSIFAREAHGDPFAVSSTYALGIAGLTSDIYDGSDSRFSAINPFNPRAAIPHGVKYFAILLKANDGNIDRALTAYNAGLGAVRTAAAKAKKRGLAERHYKNFLNKEGREYANLTRELYKKIGADEYLASLLGQEIQIARKETVLPEEEIKKIQKQEKIFAKKAKPKLVRRVRAAPESEKIIEIKKTILMVEARIESTNKPIASFKIPKKRKIILTGNKKTSRKKELLEAKFESTHFKEYIIGWVPADVLSA